MKYVKMLGLAAVAAMALMAFLGAGSASATVLCKTGETSGCAAAGNDYATGTPITSSLEATATLETTGGTVLDTCTEGTVEGTTTNTGSSSETVDGFISNLTWGNCTKTTTSLHNAKPSKEGTFGSLEIHWISGTDNGTVTGKNSRVTINSIFGSCTYGTSGTGTPLGTLTGGSPATLDIEALLPLIEGGGLCPGQGRWTGSYKVTNPSGTLDVSTN